MELTEELLLRVAKLSRKDRKKVFDVIGQQEYDRCAEDPLYWLDATRHVKTTQHPKGLPYVYTKDPHKIFECLLCGGEVYDSKRFAHLNIFHEIVPKRVREMEEKFRMYPAIRPFTLMEYMPPLVDMWTREQYMAVEKSRDVLATWTFIALATWDVMFHSGRQHIVISRDAEATMEIVVRSKIIYDNTPNFLRNAIGRAQFNKATSKSGEFKVYRNGDDEVADSEILGFPMGADQIRGLHPSMVFLDECAFQGLAEESYAAIKPAIMMGGKALLLSSANRSWFERVCRDMTDG